jgi:hypothetical protein
VQLHDKHAKDGVVCMSVSLDHSKADAQEFLDDAGADFSNYFLKDQRILSAWGFNSIPHVRVYDRTGRKVGDYSSYREVNSVVDELLRQNSN